MQIGILQHRFGVNYTPTRTWYYGWNDFDPSSIARDLDTIAFIGADHIRLMLIWPYFQPNPTAVSRAHLERLNTLMRLAGERELDVCVSLFVGWLSGYSFKPPFQRDDEFYVLGKSEAPQALYLKSVAEEIRQHENFLGFDLGNELNCCWQAQDLSVGDRWNERMLALARTSAPQGVHVNGVDHQPWFSPATFSPQQLAAAQQIVALHCWTYFTGALTRSGGDCLHPRCTGLPAAMAALARAYAGDESKPIWLQEFGMVPEWTDQENIPAFLQQTTSKAMQAGVSWFTWWSSHDVDRRYAFDPLEYSMGLMTLDQQIKPQGYAFKEIAQAYRVKAVSIPPTGALPVPPAVHTVEKTWQWLDEWLGV